MSDRHHGGGSLKPLHPVLPGFNRWKTRPVQPDDEAACRELFARVFASEISAGLWRWKYAADRGRSVLACLGGERLVAHYGGTVRRISYLGQQALALQVCDVMVDAAERGVLTRRGAFFQVASHFLESHFGQGGDFLLAYGFPTTRALKVAARLGLYAEVDQILELHWSTADLGRPLLACVEPMGAIEGRESIIDALWQEMKSSSLLDRVAVIRDHDYIQYRYFAHPGNLYECVLIRQRFTGRPLGAAFLRRESDHCKLMDLICSAANVLKVLAAVRFQVARWGLPRLVGWTTPSQRGWYDQTGYRAETTEIVIPANAWTEGIPAEALKNRWWVSLGDTDFL